MKRISSKTINTGYSISKGGRIIYLVLRFLIIVLFSPMFLILLLLIMILGGIYMLFTGSEDSINLKKYPTIVLNESKIEALGFEIYEDGDYKGKIKGCENLSIPKNIYTSFVEGYAEEVYKTDTRIYDNLCLYHLLYIKKAERYYLFEKEKEKINEIDNTLSDSKNLDIEHLKILKEEKKNLENKIEVANEALDLIQLPNIGEEKFVDYASDDEGFRENINYPIDYFKNRKKDFLDMLYYNHIGGTYGESYPEGITLGGSLFGFFGDDKIYYNLLNELGTQYNKDNIATEFLNGNYGLPDFINDLNSRGEYYNYNCPCESEDGCSCTGDPEIDYDRNFKEEELGKIHFNDYINFITYLHGKKVIYVSENVKSPFRDYVSGGKNCSVDIKLTQRDGPSNALFGFFKGYPKVDGVKTHAGIDLATEDNCNGDEVPVYSITEGIIIFKSYSMRRWGNSIIIKTNINDNDYFVRYSHLRDLPTHGVGDYITTDTLIGIQGDSGPSTAEHLDVTIYNGSLEYEDYLRDTLNWGGLFNFSFTDMMQNGFGDYTIGSFNPDTCYNCGN